MPLLVCNGGKVHLLTELLPLLGTLMLRLYVNDKVPADGDVLTDYVEASFPGYVPIPVSSWGAAILNADIPPKAQTDEVVRTFTRNSSSGGIQTVYGYMMTHSTYGLIYAERAPLGGTVISGAGQTYSVLPRMTLTNLGA